MRLTRFRLLVLAELVAVLGFSAAFSAACAGRQLPQIPDVPAAVAASDQDVKAGAAKAAGILLSAAKLANTISQIEDQAAREGAIPPAVDQGFDRAMVRYADASDAAMARIQAGVTSWDQLRSHIDPVIRQVTSLAALAEQAGAIRDRVGSWLTALKDIVLGLVTGIGTSTNFGGAR